MFGTDSWTGNMSAIDPATKARIVHDLHVDSFAGLPIAAWPVLTITLALVLSMYAFLFGRDTFQAVLHFIVWVSTFGRDDGTLQVDGKVVIHTVRRDTERPPDYMRVVNSYAGTGNEEASKNKITQIFVREKGPKNQRRPSF
ncbi:hypothetical protein BZA77DRAFT_347152 [Pyronema omphalodes]|nr:hypothetical protein BZA77DRAFT_347152 [Pyronema omphalodes]